jgi:hypothetical protein
VNVKAFDARLDGFVPEREAEEHFNDRPMRLRSVTFASTTISNVRPGSMIERVE